MTTTTIRTTCDTCQLTFDVPSAAIVLALPAPTADASVEPSFVHICPSCLACDSTTVPWRTATYLLDARRAEPGPAAATGCRGSPLGCGHAARAGSEVKRVRGELFTYPAGSRLMVRVLVTGTA